MHIEHIALYCADLEGARVFFEKYFGAKAGKRYTNEKTGFSSYFMTFDSGARLEIMTAPAAAVSLANEKGAGFAHIALSAGSREAVDGFAERFKEDGFIVNGPRITGDGYYECSVRGFERNIIEITI